MISALMALKSQVYFLYAYMKKGMSEEQLINAFMKLTAKVGAGNLIRNLVREVDENGNPKKWSPSEITHAINFINTKVETFGREDALEVIHTLMRKFDVNPADLRQAETVNDPGVKGLQ